MRSCTPGVLTSFLLSLGCLLSCSCPARPTVGFPGEATAHRYHLPALSSEDVNKLLKVATDERRHICALVLSGGSQDGAFGAGVLCNWRKAAVGSDLNGASREQGQPVYRPRPGHIDIWTGISTGALLLTHAYLGDEAALAKLQLAYTTHSDDDLMQRRSLLYALNKSALANMSGLKRLIDRTITDVEIEELGKVAKESDIITVGTTDMDTGAFVAWDMKAIAKAGEYSLYRNIILASAAIPALMDPVYIQQHMHGDGGVRRQLFLPEITYEGLKQLGNYGSTHTYGNTAMEVFLLVNGRVRPSATDGIGTCLFDILGRAVDVLEMESKLGNILRIKEQLLGMAAILNILPHEIRVYQTNIGDDFADVPRSQFDPIYMKALYNYGGRLVVSGLLWHPVELMTYRPNNIELDNTRKEKLKELMNAK